LKDGRHPTISIDRPDTEIEALGGGGRQSKGQEKLRFAFRDVLSVRVGNSETSWAKASIVTAKVKKKYLVFEAHQERRIGKKKAKRNPSWRGGTTVAGTLEGKKKNGTATIPNIVGTGKGLRRGGRVQIPGLNALLIRKDWRKLYQGVFVH